MTRRPRVLAVGGTDSSGGAGLAADVRTLHGLGVHCSIVVTAVTAQDGRAVRGVWPVPADVVRAQLDAVLDGPGADVVKTGMLVGAPAVHAVVDALLDRGLPLVVDPVGRSSTGGELLDAGGLTALRDRLLPLATVLTPNLAEASALLGYEVRTRDDLVGAAESLRALGPRWVLVTGGHLDGPAVDLLLGPDEAMELAAERVGTPHDHGSGCTLAAAIAGQLALGADVPAAVRRAKALVTDALKAGYDLECGAGPVDPPWRRAT